ncbi:MAG: hypothetical protein ACR5KW_02675 [Wolbachia sp.]
MNVIVNLSGVIDLTNDDLDKKGSITVFSSMKDGKFYWYDF